jgi:NADH-quinone oxidoreductase subunit K
VSWLTRTSWGLVSCGAFGMFLNRRHFRMMMLCLELMLLGVNLQFRSASVYYNDLTGFRYALWILTAAAAETSLGLALCVLYHRQRATLDVEWMNLLKG